MRGRNSIRRPVCFVVAFSSVAAGAAWADEPGVGPRQNGRFAMLESKKVHYVEAGAGRTTLVLVHGWASDTTVWDGQVGPFAGNMHVIALDLPGHGKSEEPGGPYSMDLFARAIASVLDDARVEKAVLVGHSNGTPTIRQFYRLYPARAQALVIVDGALKQMMPPDAVKPFIEKFKSENYKAQMADFCSQIPLVSEPLIKRITEMAVRTSQSAIIGGLEAGADPAIWKEDAIRVPTLCVMAESPFWTADYENAVRAMVPDVDYRVVAGASHFLHMESPERFNGMVLEFLAANGFLEGE